MKKIKTHLFLLLSATLVLAACKKDSSSGSGQSGAHFKCSIDGRPFQGAQGTQFINAGRYNNGTALYITGTAADSEAVFLDIKARTGEVGTFQAGSDVTLLWWTKEAMRVSMNQVGEVVLTRNDSLVVKGTFNFTNTFDANEVHTFKSGSFEVKVVQ